MTFFYPEEEIEYKTTLLRDPAYVEGLQYNLKHMKDEIFTCEGCAEQQAPASICTNPSTIGLNDDLVYAGSDFHVMPSLSTMLPELLIHIFLLLSSEDPPLIRETWDATETKILATPYLGWIHLTHVCRRWRHLTLGTAALWTNFHHGLILGSSWTETFIARAKGANTSIPPFDDYPRSNNMIRDYLLCHSPHIRDVTVSADWTSIPEIMTFCDFYLPMTVSANLDSGIDNWHTPDLFGGYAPNLKHLRLYNTIPWMAHSFLENLIDLHVFLYHNQLTTIKGEVEPIPLFLFPPLSQVLDVLEEASGLEHLSLHYAIPPEDLTVDESRKIQFPRLKSFSMASKVRDCASFLLKRLDIPHDTTLDLTCIPDSSLDLFRDIFRAMAYRIYSAVGQSPRIERLELGAARFDDRALIRVYSGHTEVGQNSDDHLAKTRFSELSRSPPKAMITLSLAYACPRDHEVILHDFFSLMPLQDLVYLSIYGCSTIEPEGWRSIIRDSYAHFQSVRFLVLSHDCAQFFFHAIHDGDDSLSDFGPPAFPNLDCLIFRRVDFSMFDRGDVSEASFQDQMLYHLRERVRRGRPLRAVFFFSCQGIDEEWFRDLEEVVKFVGLGL